MRGFTLSYAAKIFVLMILYDFCLLPAKFCYVIICVLNVESRVQIAEQCAPSKFPVVRRTLFAGATISVSHYSPNECFVGGQFNVSA
jgi:hypothetical protein